MLWNKPPVNELIKAAILEAWGSGLSENNVNIFVANKTGADPKLIDRILFQMRLSMTD
jgi:hypothetical protein